MPINKVDYAVRRSEDTNRGHSPTIWAKCPIDELLSDPRKGFYIREDFSRTALLTTPTITTQAGYSNGFKAFGSTPGTILGAGIENGQGIAMVSGTSDNDGLNIASLALPFKISRSNGDFWFETRLKCSAITNTTGTGVFVGLLESVTLTAIVPITAAGALADKNLVGFFRTEALGTDWGTVYKADGITAVTVKATGMSDLPTTTALVADTFVKLGMSYRKNDDKGAFQLKFYINGYELPDRYTMASAAGTDFPNDVQMGLVVGSVNGAGAAHTVTVDWIEACQLSASDTLGV